MKDGKEKVKAFGKLLLGINFIVIFAYIEGQRHEEGVVFGNFWWILLSLLGLRMIEFFGVCFDFGGALVSKS